MRLSRLVLVVVINIRQIYGATMVCYVKHEKFVIIINTKPCRATAATWSQQTCYLSTIMFWSWWNRKKYKVNKSKKREKRISAETCLQRTILKSWMNRSFFRTFSKNMAITVSKQSYLYLIWLKRKCSYNVLMHKAFLHCARSNWSLFFKKTLSISQSFC